MKTKRQNNNFTRTIWLS